MYSSVATISLLDVAITVSCCLRRLLSFGVIAGASSPTFGVLVWQLHRRQVYDATSPLLWVTGNDPVLDSANSVSRLGDTSHQHQCKSLAPVTFLKKLMSLGRKDRVGQSVDASDLTQ